MNRNHIQGGLEGTSLRNKAKSMEESASAGESGAVPRRRDVDMAGGWRESYRSYPGRSHGGRFGGKPSGNRGSRREKSAEAVVSGATRRRAER
jgi:hypothetical protein